MDCPPDKIIFDSERGEYICTETGEVLEDRVVDQGAEWRAYTPEEKITKSRVGAPILQTVHDLGISTMIGLNTKVNKERRLEALKLMKIQKQTRLGSNSLPIIRAMQEIERIGSLMGLPKAIKEEAAILFKKAYEKKITQRRNMNGIVVACIYLACRVMKLPKTLHEIIKYTDVDKTTIGKYYRLILSTLNITVLPNNPRDFIIEYGNMLGLSMATINKAFEFEEKIRGKIIGKNPRSIASALLYISALLNDERITQKDISKVSQISEISIRGSYKKIIDVLGIDENILNEKKIKNRSTTLRMKKSSTRRTKFHF